MAVCCSTRLESSAYRLVKSWAVFLGECHVDCIPLENPETEANGRKRTKRKALICWYVTSRAEKARLHGTKVANGCVDDLKCAIDAWVLRLLDPALLPPIATNALAAGQDSPSLRLLAGLQPHEADRATDLFVDALHELSVLVPSASDAALSHSRCVAALIVAGTISPREGAHRIWDVSLAVGDSSFHALDSFVYLASEYDGRPDDQPRFDQMIRDEAERWSKSG